jgi:hypothetical protein
MILISNLPEILFLFTLVEQYVYTYYLTYLKQV